MSAHPMLAPKADVKKAQNIDIVPILTARLPDIFFGT